MLGRQGATAFFPSISAHSDFDQAAADQAIRWVACHPNGDIRFSPAQTEMLKRAHHGKIDVGVQAHEFRQMRGK